MKTKKKSPASLKVSKNKAAPKAASTKVGRSAALKSKSSAGKNATAAKAGAGKLSQAKKVAKKSGSKKSTSLQSRIVKSVSANKDSIRKKMTELPGKVTSKGLASAVLGAAATAGAVYLAKNESTREVVRKNAKKLSGFMEEVLASKGKGSNSNIEASDEE